MIAYRNNLFLQINTTYSLKSWADQVSTLIFDHVPMISLNLFNKLQGVSNAFKIVLKDLPATTPAIVGDS